MGSSISAILAILFMDKLGIIALSSHLKSPYKRTKTHRGQMLLTLSATQHLNTFDDMYILRLNGYTGNSIEQTKRPQNPQRNPQPANTEWSYLKIPYISERLNHRITNIFRKENIPVRIAHKSYTLRQALYHTFTERKCTRVKCPISNTGLRSAIHW